MKITDLRPAEGSRKQTKRRGRGESSGLGKTAGKGNKGQLARSGTNHRAWFEGGQMPLQRRMPSRGFKNPFRKNIATVNVADLNKFENGQEVTIAVLCAKGLVPGRKDKEGNWSLSQRVNGVKVLGDGELTRKLTVRVHAFSATAKSKIEAAGGTVAALETGEAAKG